MQMLIKAGAKLEALDQKGYNALEFSFLNKRTASVGFLRPLYRARAKPHDLSVGNLQRAITEKNDDAMIRALALGLDPNKTIDGKFPVDIAAQAGYDTGVALLIHAGAVIKKATLALK
jgi:ankyrin repeat protein